VDPAALAALRAWGYALADAAARPEGAARLADALKAKARAEAAARSRPADPARAATLAQMEADKRERASRGPVTVGSVAVPKGALGPRGVGGMSMPATGAGGGAAPHASAAGVRCVHDAAAWRAVLEEGRKAGRAVIVDFTATWWCVRKGMGGRREGEGRRRGLAAACVRCGLA
jgi:hypothetical protein